MHILQTYIHQTPIFPKYQKYYQQPINDKGCVAVESIIDFRIADESCPPEKKEEDINQKYVFESVRNMHYSDHYIQCIKI